MIRSYTEGDAVVIYDVETGERCLTVLREEWQDFVNWISTLDDPDDV
jgi:hypothetical protein